MTTIITKNIVYIFVTIPVALFTGLLPYTVYCVRVRSISNSSIYGTNITSKFSAPNCFRTNESGLFIENNLYNGLMN